RRSSHWRPLLECGDERSEITDSSLPRKNSESTEKECPRKHAEHAKGGRIENPARPKDGSARACLLWICFASFGVFRGPPPPCADRGHIRVAPLHSTFRTLVGGGRSLRSRLNAG